MTGRVKDACVKEIRNAHDPHQYTLSNYGTDTYNTTIAIVSKPADSDIVELCDEWHPVLGMPEAYLTRYLKTRSKYRMNSAIDNPGNVAYDELELDRKYKEYIRSSDEAQEALDAIAERVASGEEIVLVCFEEEGERCHRHVLSRMVEARVNLCFSIQ